MLVKMTHALFIYANICIVLCNKLMAVKILVQQFIKNYDQIMLVVIIVI